MEKIGTASLVLLVTLSLVVLPACSTVNPYTGEKQTSKATEGSAIGGIAGAILGAATASRGDRTKMALIGAGVGAIAGGGVGYYMDVQEAKLRQKLEGTGVRVVRDGKDIHLVMPGDVTFETDSASLNARFFEVLDSVALVLNEYKSTLVTVAGYTDSTGSADYNQKLSEKRWPCIFIAGAWHRSGWRPSDMVRKNLLQATITQKAGPRTAESRSRWTPSPTRFLEARRRKHSHRTATSTKSFFLPSQRYPLISRIAPCCTDTTTCTASGNSGSPKTVWTSLSIGEK
jgi:outer membrane protein OmpA-like peptidoglycan-associated protein